MKHIYSLFSILFAALLMAGCVNDPDIDGGIRNAKKPSVKTDEILKSTASSVTVSGEVLQENGAPVTEAGFCWSTESTFTVIEKNKKAVSKRKVKYEATIEGLTNDLDYYIRAYAINAVDTAYGEILPFKTKDGLGSVNSSQRDVYFRSMRRYDNQTRRSRNRGKGYLLNAESGAFSI